MRVVRVLLFYLCLGKTKLLPHSTEERQQGNVKKLKACMRHFLKDSFGFQINIGTFAFRFRILVYPCSRKRQKKRFAHGADKDFRRKKQLTINNKETLLWK